jgi:uncharacterized membrane protein YbhN (UPF0104 family)
LILLASLIYGAAMMLIAESWHHIVAGLTAAPPSRFTTWPSFGVTQVAKYLPGNVFHYVGRHVWLNRQGVTHGEAIAAMLWEVVLLCGSALLCASAVLAVWPIPIVSVAPADISAGATLVLAALVLGFLSVIAVRKAVPRLRRHIPRAVALIVSGLALLAFFALQGLAFSLLFPAVGQRAAAGAVAVAILSWLVGYATPGAPGGIGSREAVLVALAAPLTGAADALILAALFRVVTTGGDFVCFGLSSLVALRGVDRPAHSPQPAQPTKSQG